MSWAWGYRGLLTPRLWPNCGKTREIRNPAPNPPSTSCKVGWSKPCSFFRAYSGLVIGGLVFRV